MALIRCSECGAEISDKAVACVRCGAPVLTPKPTSSPAFDQRNTPPPEPERVGGPLWLWVVGSIALLIGLVSLAPSRDPKATAESDAQWRAEKAIDLCWEQQARKSMAPETQRFIAGACEIGEEDYFKKYGRYHTRYGKRP